MPWKQSLSILLTLALLLGCGAWTPVRAAAQTEPAAQAANEVEDTPEPAAVTPIIPILPVPEIEINYSTKTVNENSGFALTASIGTSGTVTWSTDNSYVASVSSSGYVSAHHAGAATITATLTDAYGETFTADCTVYVTVADGMYYIKNASSEQCITTGGSTAALYAQETGEDSRLGQLWLIEYDESSRLYRICPIRDISRALTVDQNNYVAVDDVEPQFCWDIVSYSLGYAIQYAGDSSDTAKPVVASMPGSQIYLGDWQASLSCHWELESSCGIFLRDVDTFRLVEDSTEIILGVGRVCSMLDLGICCEYYGNLSNEFSWHSSNTAIVDIDSFGQLTGIASGVSITTVSVAQNNTVYSASCIVRVESSVLVLSNNLDEWLESSQTMGANMAAAVSADYSSVEAVDSNNFSALWNNTTSDHIIIHTHGSSTSLEGEGFQFGIDDISTLQRNSAIRFVLITACSTGGPNGDELNIAALLSQYIAADGIVVCCTTNVEGGSTDFKALDGGAWIAYCNGEAIDCNLPTTITMSLVADYWEEFR